MCGLSSKSKAAAGADDGFTLIETIVALIIFVACYVLIQQGLALGWRGVSTSQGELKALHIAEARLAAAGVESPLSEGQQTGSENGYSWVVDVRRQTPEIEGDRRARASDRLLGCGRGELARRDAPHPRARAQIAQDRVAEMTRLDPHRQHGAGEAGFSLMEMLIALVILALILGFMPGAFRLARQVWTATAELDRDSGHDAGLDFVETRLAEAMPLFEPSKAGLVNILFSGMASASRVSDR